MVLKIENLCLYSKEFEEMAREMIRNARERITVHQTRNFIDYDIVPFVRDVIKKLMDKEER